MKNWIIPGALIALVMFALVFVAGARASYGDARLNAVASAVAGHPVVVSCGSGAGEWSNTEKSAGLTFEVDGFTTASQSNVIYLAPRICDTLEADFTAGPNAVGDFWNGLAIKTIIHESVHQRGVLDESVTDCTALSLVQTYAPSFGYAKTITQKVIASKLVKGKRVLYVKLVTVTNPALARLQFEAKAWHDVLPPSYRTVC